MENIANDLREILSRALEKTPAERKAYLDVACAGSVPLRREVESLLRLEEQIGDFLTLSPVDPSVVLDGSAVPEGPGSMIGNYLLLDVIGEGGMAVVFSAEQQTPIRRRVALKIIKPGMDTKQVIARFEAERQALAWMDHQNIARVFDAGATVAGRPYFVMELVSGVSITEYCDQNRLSIAGRLALFASVCNAVQHAHQKGIIHRDIKPSNIIVTQHDGKPIPKVIDFGIAKATNQKLTEKTLFTRHAHIIGTPAYMSPEQAELSDLDVDTRTDIYSLGILLYELLTGTTPFGEEQLREAGYLQMQKIICETEPIKPSTKLGTLGQALTDIAKWRDCSPELMPRLVRGDLDWIVMKSLEKDRTRRYDTASALALDVQRYLDSEPVQAAAPSVTYKLRKFARRHRALVAGSSLAAAALLVVAAMSALYAREVTTHARESEAARKEITGLLAGSYVDQAQTLCEQGHVGRGMLWLAHSLEIAGPGSSKLSRAIRRSLAGWYGQLHSLATVVQYPSKINAVTFSPDGTRVLAACMDGTVLVCDSVTGEPVGRPLRHGSEVVALAVSPDGRKIATGGSDGSVRLWDMVTLKPVGEPMQNAKSLVVAFSPDSARLATCGDDGTLRFWGADTGEPLGKGWQYESQSRWLSARAVVSSPDGLRVVLQTGRSTYQMFDADSDEPVGPPVDPGREAFAVAISPEAKRFITGDGGGTVRVWDAATGRQAQDPLMHGGSTYTLAFSPDGSRIASGGASRMTRLWDATTGALVGSPMRQRSTVTAAAISPDGAHLVTGNQGGVVRQWDLVQDRHVGKMIESQGRLCGAVFCRGDLWVLTQIDGMVQLRNEATGAPIGRPFSGSQWIVFTALSPDGSRLVTQRAPAARELRLWDVATGQSLGEIHHREPQCVVFSPDGSRILTGGEDNVARLWDVATLQCLAGFHQFQGIVSRAAFSPDGSRFLIGSFDGTTRLWDAATLQQIGEPLFHQSEVKGLTFSPDGTKILIGFADGTIRLYDAATHKPIGTPLQHLKLVSSVAYSPDGSLLLAGCLDGTARLWDAATFKPIGPPLEHDCGWPRASFSENGLQILLYGQGRAQVWRTPSTPLTGDLERIVCWVQVITGMELDETGGINVLDAGTWNLRRKRLQELGGPPPRGVSDFDGRSEMKGL